jgi:aminoglycoside phosphotransferase (APT) family kinase protein
MATPAELAAGTSDVLETHRFEVGALEAWMARHVEGFRGPLTVRQFLGGQSNPTYYLRTPDRQYVLRRKPPGKLLPSAHAVDREYRVITALGHTDVPVPRTYGLCLDESVVGTVFYVMAYVEGRVLADPRLLTVAKAERRPIYDAMNDVLARLHRVDWRAVGLADFGKPGNYVARQIHRWTQQYRASETETVPAMERLIEWLPAHVPPHEDTTIVHGDYRLGNMLVHPTEPRVVAVLDWELATLGNPLSDLAYNCLPYRLSGEVMEGFQGADLVEMGMPSEEEYVAAYCRRTGRPGIEDWDFYIVFSIFRLSAIAQGIMGRVIAGTANDPNAIQRGKRARPLAEAAWAIVERRGG